MSIDFKPKPKSGIEFKPKATAPTAPATVPKESGFLGTTPGDSAFGKVIDNSVTRGIQAFFPGKQVGQAIGTLGGFGLTAAKEKLGFAPKGATAAYDLSAPSPLQVVGDVAKGAATVAGAKMPLPGGSSVLGKIGQAALQSGKIGVLAGAGQAATETSGKPVPNLKDALQIAKGAAAGGATGAVVGATVSAAGQLISAAGDKIMNSVIRPSQADVKDGFSIETVKKYDLGGSLRTTYQKTESKLDELSGQLNEKLAASGKTIDMNEVYQRTAERLVGEKNKLTTFGSNARVSGALDDLLAEINSLGGVDNLPITDAQIVKRAAGHYGAWTYGVPDPDTTARQTVYNVFYNELKSTIEKNSPDGVQGLNQQLSELIPVMNAVIRRIPVAERNNLLSLTDIITLSASALNPSALGGFAANLASKSGTVGNALSKSGTGIQRLTSPLGGLLGGGAAAVTPEKQSP